MTDSTPVQTFHGHGMGAKKQPIDPRDKMYGDHQADKDLKKSDLSSLPPSALVPNDAAVPILDQKWLGSCVANEAVAHYAIVLVTEGSKPLLLSRLELYFKCRQMYNVINEDTGATGRDAADVLHRLGCCPERSWKYVPEKFKTAPPVRCTNQDEAHQLTKYLAIPAHSSETLDQLRTSLAAGYPVGYSFDVYENFHPDAQGVIPMPSGRIAGGHRMLLVGYDDARGLFRARNSWGPPWADGGRCWFHYDHVLQQFEDLWTYRLVE